MTATVRVELVSVTADPDTGDDIIAVDAVVYVGAAKVKGSTIQSSPAIPATVTPSQIHFPATATVIPVGCRITVEASANQPNLVDRVYRATQSHVAEFQTAQRVEVESWQ